MAEIKTKATVVDPAAFIAAVPDERRRSDAIAVDAMMTRVTGEPARMWGPSIVGYGDYHYKYDSGHEGTMCRLGFSPRKAELVLYVLTGARGEAELLAKLGKHKTGKSCLYVKRLADVDTDVLEALTANALAYMDHKYPKG